jgi:hypothetical protein
MGSEIKMFKGITCFTVTANLIADLSFVTMDRESSLSNM